METAELTREIIPRDMPLLLRISAMNWLEDSELDIESWMVEDTVRFAKISAEKGVDLIDASSGGIHEKQHIRADPGCKVPFAKAVKEAFGDKMAVGMVRLITAGKQANNLLDGGLDLVIIGRQFQKNPGLV
jgi:2,4-dienoyl-CoA reductase-like NADH-dependent reductase (Old Yellow Enzyme family)